MGFPPKPAPGASVELVDSEEGYEVSTFRWSDGKFGASIRVQVRPGKGETFEEAATRANRFAVMKLREEYGALRKEIQP